MTRTVEKILNAPFRAAGRVGIIGIVSLLLVAASPSSAQEEVAPEQDVPPAWEDVVVPATADSEPGAGTFDDPATRVPVARATVLGPPGHRDVRSVRKLRTAGRVDWSRQGAWIAFDQAGDDGLYDIYLYNLETESEKCLTCNWWDFRKVNALDPVWHPSGEYLIFRVQRSARRLKMDVLDLAGPPRGLHSDLWAAPRDGEQFWQLTRIAENGGAVVDPHFSFEGDQLVWSERLVSVSGTWGQWAARVAELEIRRGLPRLGKVKTYEPLVGEQGFLVAHGFSPDDRGLLMSTVHRGEAGRDLLRLDLEDGSVERLTNTVDQRDDLVTIAPRVDRRVWVSSRNTERLGRRVLPYRGDLWMFDTRSRREERLTYFNDLRSDHGLGEALIDDYAWSPDGDRLLVHVVSVEQVKPKKRTVKPGQAPPPREEELLDLVPREALYLVELGEGFRPPGG